MRDRFDAVILASCGEKTRKFKILRETSSIVVMDAHHNKAEKTRKFKILRETTSIVVMDTHDNKAVYLEQPSFSFIKRFWQLQCLIWGPLITDFNVSQFLFRQFAIYQYEKQLKYTSKQIERKSPFFRQFAIYRYEIK